jgi:hypothetical protein
MQLIRFKRGPYATMPKGEVGEPLYTKDTLQLFIGTGPSTLPVPLGGYNYKAGLGGVQAFKLVYVLTDGKVSTFDASNPLLTNAIGISYNSATENNSVYVLSSGIVQNPLWNLQKGRLYYASSSGDINIIYLDSGIYQEIGTAIDTNTLLLNIGDALKI